MLHPPSLPWVLPWALRMVRAWHMPKRAYVCGAVTDAGSDALPTGVCGCVSGKDTLLPTLVAKLPRVGAAEEANGVSCVAPVKSTIASCGVEMLPDSGRVPAGLRMSA